MNNDYAQDLIIKLQNLILNFDPYVTQADVLEGSILNWEIIVSGGNSFVVCSLCDYSVGCKNCIIKKDTGKEGCRGTPYGEYIVAKADEKQKKARQELKYLIGLRDKITEEDNIPRITIHPF